MRVEDFAQQALEEALRRARDEHAHRGARLLQGLGLGSIEVRGADGIGSARLRRGADGPVIELDPAFLAKHVRHPADALHLLGHELLHRVRGDLCRFVAVDRAAWTLFNLALDMFVDAQLERLWFRGDGAPYLRRLYWPDRFPDLLLLPPRVLLQDLGGPEARRFLAAGPMPWSRKGAPERMDLELALQPRLRRLGVADPRAVADLYADAWLDQSDFASFWSRFRDQMRDELPGIYRADLPLLLGEHGAPGSRDPMLAELADLLGHALGSRVMGGPGRGLDPASLEPLQETPDPGPLLTTLLRAVEADPHAPTVRSRVVPERGVVPAVGRRELFALAAGATPVFWRTAVPRQVEDHERVHLYVDASGSMDEWLPFLFRLVSVLGEHVGDSVQLFSTEVVDATLQDLGQGRFQTTGGTDFGCVLEHALDRGWRRIVLVTDGWADVDGGQLARARSEGLSAYVVLLGGAVNEAHPLSELPGGTWTWEPLRPQA